VSEAIARLNTALEARYAVEREIGAGGMATVFLAKDLKHNRNVALKVLKPELAAVVGAERFLTEIETTANLQHPHILPLYDSGEADSMLFYVMPYVEGESLRERLDRDHQLPVDDAVRIATNMAEALDYAHRRGVIHRDIKPANVLLQDGKPVISDFGIALAVGVAGGGRLTETGLSMGTPYYMSPEQASADREPTPASDVYSLGCVLYEMLVGEPPYVGSSAQAVLAKILMGDAPAAAATRASIPANVDAAIRKALEKLPADRFTGVQDFAKALDDPGFRHGDPGGPDAAGTAARVGPWSRVSVGVAVLLGLVAAWGWLRPVPAPIPPAPMTASLLFPNDSGPADGFDLSPDGTRLAFVSQARLDGGRIWIRTLLNGRQSPLEGTERAASPAWSPTGDRIAYRVDNTEIRVVSADGGPVVTVVEASAGVGMPSWTPDGTIIFLGDGGIMTAPAGGGQPKLVVPMDEVDFFNGVVEPLPDGRGFLAASVRPDAPGIFVGDLRTAEYELLIEASGNPLYRDGWLFSYAYEGPLLAQRFDPGSRELVGAATPLVDQISEPGGRVQLAVGPHTLVFASPPPENRALVWVDGSGGPGAPLAEPSIPEGWERVLSRDGARIASGGWGLWVVDADGGLPRRIQGAGDRARSPQWSEDGRVVLYRGGAGLSMVGIDPGDSAVLIRPSGSSTLVPVGWGADGEVLFIEILGDGSRELRALDSGGTGNLRTILPGVGSASLSPDGRWLAYDSRLGSDESQVFIRAYTDSEEIRVSTDGGARPRWGPNGDEVYFVTRRGQAWQVSLSFDGGLAASVPELVPFDGAVRNIWTHPDGRLLLEAEYGGGQHLSVLRDWKSVIAPGGF